MCVENPASKEWIEDCAHDYLSKPFDVDELKINMRNMLEQRQLRQETVLVKAAELLGMSFRHSATTRRNTT